MGNPVQPSSISVVADRPDALYRCGETAVFTVSVDPDADGAPASGEATVTLDNFGLAEQLRRTVDLSKENPFTVRGTLAEPGFLRLCVRPDRAIVCGVGMGHDGNTRPDLLRILSEWLRAPPAGGAQES